MAVATPLLRCISAADEPLPPLPLSPAMPLKYEPDRFQRFAIDAIERGYNVLITAKTGSGKTFVGEYQIARSLSRGGRVFYTTPIKSLSNQKFHDLKELFPQSSVGIMTGDIKFNPEAQILVMTTEILRNLLFKRGTSTEEVGLTSVISMKDLDAVVFDEVHYINDPDRGHVWEETIMLLPPSIHMVLLSATLAHPEPFARWIAELKQTPLWLISTQWRAVPLYHHVWSSGASGGERLLLQDAKEVYHDDVYRRWLESKRSALLAVDAFKQKVKDARRGGVEGAIEGKQRIKSFEYELNNCLKQLHARSELPAIIFIFSRAGCEKAAAAVEEDFLDSSDAAAVGHIWDFHLSRFSESLETMRTFHNLRRLAQRGIAFHHSGLVPFLKEILEILFSKGLVKVLFATETFAVGINMPTKTVIFTGLEKYDSTLNGFRVLRSDEYIQMAGRAGRRGKDDKGIVIYLPQKDPIEAYEMRRCLTGGAATVSSRITFHYDFILKTLQNPQMEWKHMMESSYWYRLYLAEKEAALRSCEQKRKLVHDGRLDDVQHSACEERVAIEVRIATSGNSKKKTALRELQAWNEAHPEKHWEATLTRWKQWSVLAEEVKRDEQELADAEGAVGADLRARLCLLEERGFVKQSESGKWTVDEKGRLASEVNEGHPLLMVEIFQSGKMRSLSLIEQLSVLAAFLGERQGDDMRRIILDDTPLSMEQKGVLQMCEESAVDWMRAERAAGLRDDAEFWELSYEWVEPMVEWLNGASLSQIAGQFEMFEGNVQRAVLKLAGLAEEWITLLTLGTDVEQLRVWEGVRELILRDIVVAESLYLRL